MGGKRKWEIKNKIIRTKEIQKIVQEILETMNLLEALETKVVVQIERVVNYNPLLIKKATN